MGAYIGITENDTMGSVGVSLGEFSADPVQYSQEIHDPVSIDVVLANEEVWSDKPDVVFAVQVRDSLLSTRFSGEEMNVSAFVNHSMQYQTNTHVSKLNNESGVCVMSISLENHQPWFTESGDNVSLTVTFRNVSSTTQVTLRLATDDTNSSIFMRLPAYSVSPGDKVDIPIYATYDHFLSSFTLKCSVDDDDAWIKEFTGSNKWSLITSFPGTGRQQQASVTGFRNYGANNVSFTGSILDDLANLSVVIGNVTVIKTITVQCEAVGLLLTTKVSPEVNIFLNATDREGVRIGKGILFVQPISVVKLFAHSGINQVINIANLTNTQQNLDLTIQAFYSNGILDQITDNLVCNSVDDDIIKVDSSCLNVFFNGTETEGAESNITVALQDTNANGYIPFRVWLPSNTVIQVRDNTTLNRIVKPCLDSDPLYQNTYVHVVTNLTSSGKTPIQSVHITSVVLPYLKSTNEKVLTINTTTGEIMGIDAGEAAIMVPDTSYAINIIVSHTAVGVEYLDVFLFSNITLNITGNTVEPSATTNVKISLLQDFSYINSEVNMVSVAVFSDGQRMVLDGDMLTIAALWRDSLNEMKGNRYSIAEEVNNVGFDINWNTSDGCIIENREYCVSFNSSTPQSIEIRTDSVTVANSTDPASLIGTPHTVVLKVFLVYEENPMVDVTLNHRTNITIEQNSQNVKQIMNGKIEATGLVTGMANITVEYQNLTNQTSITVVKGESLMVLAHPYPPYEGSLANNVTTIRKIGSSFQMVEIEVKLILSNGSSYNITSNDGVNITTDSSVAYLTGNVLSIQNSTTSTNVSVTVMFSTLENKSVLKVDATTPQIKSFSNIALSSAISGLNQYQIEFGVTFEGNVFHNSISSSDYPDLVEFSSSDGQNLTINGNGLVQILYNSHENICICVISKTNGNVSNCTNFNANLQPDIGELDLGDLTGPPLTPVNVDNTFVVPVFLNNFGRVGVGIFEMELTFSNKLVQFVDVRQGSDWESGQIVYVDPDSDDNRISFGGILHTGAIGSRLNLANVTFLSKEEGLVAFSANTSFIAAANVDVTLLSENTTQVSDSSRINLCIESSGMQRRAAGEYTADKKPPLPSPPRANQMHRVTRLRRQAMQNDDCEPNCVRGDANGDRLVDLRDVYLLQLYIAESVFNFSSPLGQQLVEVIGNKTLDVDGDNIFTLVDVEELEIITQLNLAYKAVLNATVDYNSTIDKCSIEISGQITAISDDLPPAGINVSVVLGFISSKQVFGDVFGNISFITDEFRNIKKSTIDQPDTFGGNVKVTVNNPKAVTDFRLDGTVDSISVGFNVSVALIVTDKDGIILSFSNDIRGSDEAASLLELDHDAFPLTRVGMFPPDACVRSQSSTPVIEPSTTSVASSPSPSLSSDTLELTSTMTVFSSDSQIDSTSSPPVFSSNLVTFIVNRTSIIQSNTTSITSSPSQSMSSDALQLTSTMTLSSSDLLIDGTSPSQSMSSDALQLTSTMTLSSSDLLIDGTSSSPVISSGLVVEATSTILSSTTSITSSLSHSVSSSSLQLTSSVTLSSSDSPIDSTSSAVISSTLVTSAVEATLPSSSSGSQETTSVASVSSSQGVPVPSNSIAPTPSGAPLVSSSEASSSSSTATSSSTALEASSSTPPMSSNAPSEDSSSSSIATSSSTALEASSGAPPMSSNAPSEAASSSSTATSTASSGAPPMSSNALSEVSSSSSTATSTSIPGEETTKSSANTNNSTGIIGAVLSVVIVILLITVIVCGGFVFLRRRKGQYLIEQSNGTHIRNSMVSDGSSYWQDTENGIVSEVYSYCIYCVAELI